MKKDTRSHNWKKGQPHHVSTGKLTTRAYAKNHPDKVEWVKDKKTHRRS